MAARQPRVFIDHSAKPFGDFVISAFPERTERACRTDNRQIINAVLRGNFGQLVRHPRAAGNTGYHASGLLQHAVQDALCAAHFPQDVDVDRALATGNFIGAFDLRDAAANAVFDQLFMSFSAGFAVKHLRNHVAFVVITIRIHRRNRPDSASGSPCARTRVIGRGNAFTAFD